MSFRIRIRDFRITFDLDLKVSRYCSMNGDLSQSLKIVKNVECRHLIFSLETDNEQDTQIRFDVLIGTTLKGRP